MQQIGEKEESLRVSWEFREVSASSNSVLRELQMDVHHIVGKQKQSQKQDRLCDPNCEPRRFLHPSHSSILPLLDAQVPYGFSIKELPRKKN
jgi:hypothetical protein